LTFNLKTVIFTREMIKVTKNILLLTVTGLFFIFNSGFTLTTYYCKMQQKSSFSGCEMCEAQKQEVNDCCEEETNTGEEGIVSVSNKCCEATIYTIVGTDEYLPNQSGSIVKSSQVDLIPFTLTQHEYSAFFAAKFISGSSPPTETTPKLFLSNHNFRI